MKIGAEAEIILRKQNVNNMQIRGSFLFSYMVSFLK
jgi:hypothetical protein